MRIFGYDIRRAGRDGPRRSPEAHKTARAVLPSPLARYGVGGSRRDRPVDLELYRELRVLLPLVDVAIHKLTRLVGYVRVEAPPDLAGEIERFLRHVPVNGLERGFDSFLVNHVGQMLQYGFSAGEIVPDGGRRGVKALVNFDSRYVHILDDDPPLKRGIGYQAPGMREPTRIPDSLALFSVNAPEGESLYGTSLLRSLPFVAHIILTMERALQQTWERMGAPAYQVNWQPPEGFVDPDGTKTRQVMSEIETGFTQAMQTRHDSGLVSDFFAAGDVRVSVLGADGAQLEFRETYRALTEQIVARTGLPPFMLGLSWASRETMSVQQADMLISEVKDFRRELEPMVEKIVDLYLALTGRAGLYRLRWSEVTLQDLREMAEAAHRRALARKVESDTLAAAVDRGWITSERARDELFPEARTDPRNLMPSTVPGADEETG